MGDDDLGRLADTSDQLKMFCGCPKCVAHHVELAVAKSGDPDLADHLRAIAEVAREWPVRRLATLAGGGHRRGTLSREGIEAVVWFSECVLDTLEAFTDEFTSGFDPEFDLADFAPPPGEVQRELNTLWDGTIVDIELRLTPVDTVVARCVSDRAKDRFGKRPDLRHGMFVATDTEAAEIRAAAGEGWVIREYDDRAQPSPGFNR